MSFYISLISKTYLLPVYFLFCAFAVSAQSVDSSAFYKISGIKIEGNRKTKTKIITRELTKKPNDTIALKDVGYFLKRSQQNIFNTQLFIYDTIYPSIDHNNKTISVNISVRERWYVFPIPVFEIQDRNFNSWWQTKDLFRINYGFALAHENFTGVKDKFVLLFQRGYSEKYGFSYRIPYINKAQTLGFNMLYVYGRNNEVTYTTKDNVPMFVRDYGKYLRTEHEAKVGIIYRPNLYEQTTLELLHKTSQVKDTVVKLNSDFFGESIKQINYQGLQYRYTYDNRDNKVYPLNGWAFDLWAIKDGFNFSQDATVNNLYLIGSLRKHTPLGGRFFLSNLAKGRLINNDYISYNFNRALGYTDAVRGYEYYIVDGQRFFLAKNSLRFQLLKPRVYENPLLKNIKQFGTIPYYAFINVFFDAAYVEDKFYAKTNNLTNSWQYGYGVGLDFISYYDLVLRLEYSFNKQLQHGFFIHLTSGF